METKCCKICNVVKSINCYIKIGGGKTHTHCKDCYKIKYGQKKKEADRLYRENKRKELNIKAKEYREKNIEKIKKQEKLRREKDRKCNKKTWAQRNPLLIKESAAKTYSKYKEKRKMQSSEWRKKNVESFKAIQKKYYQRNRSKLLLRQKSFREKNPDYFSNYAKERERIDENFKIVRRLRSRVYSAMKGISKNKKTLNLLGCTVDELKAHLEKQFAEGMTWDNYGQWHIDHILPCASFDLTKESEQRKCFHYTNLQPLWASDNCSKQDKI